MSVLLNVAIDTGAQPPVSTMTLFGGPTVARVSLGESSTIVAMCADGAMLACMYQPAMALLHLMRRGDHMPLLMQLRDRSPWAYLLIDGFISCGSSGKASINSNPCGFDWAAVQGMLLSIQELGVGVLTLQDTKHLGDTIYGLAKRDRATKRVRPPREALFVEPLEDLLLALPGIGDERCRTLLRHCGGNGAAALDALTDPHHTIPGINRKVKENTREILGLTAGTRLAVLGMTDEEAMYETEATEVAV